MMTCLTTRGTRYFVTDFGKRLLLITISNVVIGNVTVTQEV